jgi:glycosyltransferase involved in cell wall biosynthesis
MTAHPVAGVQLSRREVVESLSGQKIVFLLGFYGRGGAQRQVYLLARAMKERYGLDVEVWALGYDGEYIELFEAAGIPTRPLEFGFPRCPVKWVRLLYWGKRLWKVATQLRQARVRILLPYTTYPNVVAGLSYRLAGVRLCIWGERHAGCERAPVSERIAARQYRRFIANSTAGVEFLINEMNVPGERISFVPNGVEEPQVNPQIDWRARLDLKPGQLLVIKLANITRFKDHATLLRGWKIVQDAWVGTERPILALAGYCSEAYDECHQFVVESGMEATVRFLGSINEVPELVDACDIAAFSSRNEGMPNGVLECMAAGKAIVSSDLPGVRDAMGPLGAEVLVTPGDAEGFARILLALLRDSKRREALGEANRARIRDELSVERMVERHLKVILTHFAGRTRGQESEAALVGRPEQA